MSHFSVIVIGEDVVGQMAPYQENNMGDCPREYMEFHDMGAELHHDYWNDTVERILLADGRMLSPYDNEFEQGGIGERTRVYPPDSTRVEKRVYEVFTYQEYAEDYCGYEIDPEFLRYGYWRNPNTKWDWYQVGGRWSGYFKLKDTAEDGTFGTGSPGVFGNKPRLGYVDSLLRKDLDLDGMYADARKEANRVYDVLEEVTAGIEPPTQTWNDLRESVVADGGTIEDARAQYNAHPWMRAVEGCSELRSIFDDPIEKYCILRGGRNKYVSRCECASIVPFAIVKDGKWYERGEMGWWGVVLDEKDKDDWTEQAAKLLGDLPPDTRLTVVDCHI